MASDALSATMLDAGMHGGYTNPSSFGGARRLRGGVSCVAVGHQYGYGSHDVSSSAGAAAVAGQGATGGHVDRARPAGGAHATQERRPQPRRRGL
jgi:hypothetical protein